MLFSGQLDSSTGAAALLAPSLRGLAKIGSSDPIFDWGSVVFMIGHSLRHGFRRATSLFEGGKAASPHNAVNNNFSFQISYLLLYHKYRSADNYFYKKIQKIRTTLP